MDLKQQAREAEIKNIATAVDIEWLDKAIAQTWLEASEVALIAVCSECKGRGTVNTCGGCLGTGRPSNSSVATAIDIEALKSKAQDV